MHLPRILPVVAFVGRDGEGGVPRGGDRGGVHVRALVQQDPPNLGVSPRGGLHQRREPGLGAVLHVGLTVQQQRHNLNFNFN